MKIKILLFFFAILHSTFFAQWSEINSMNVMRSSHVSCIFDNDKILVAGGFSNTIQTKTAEVYDPISGMWTSTNTEMNQFHSSGTLTKINANKAIICGGWTGSENTSTCEIYDLNLNTWTNTASLTYGRSDHTATRLQNGKILVVGGYNGIENIKECELFDPNTNSWTTVTPLSIGRSNHTATLLNDGRVLITGGFNPNFNFQLNSTEIYNPNTNTWELGPNLSAGRNLHAASKLQDGKVLITGGESFTGEFPFAYRSLNSAEIFDPNTNSLSPVQNIPSGLSHHKQQTISKYAVLIGGLEQTDYAGTFTYVLGKSYLYNSESNSWTETLTVNSSRYYFTSELSSDLKVFSIGGNTENVEVLDLNVSNLNNLKPSVISVFPTIVDSKIEINSSLSNSKFSVDITDLSGRKIKNFDFINSSLIDLSELNPGNYILIVHNNDFSSKHKIIKQ